MSRTLGARRRLRKKSRGMVAALGTHTHTHTHRVYVFVLDSEIEKEGNTILESEAA